MKVIAIEGIIGWDIYASDVRKLLEEAAGDEVDLIVNSPGGFVYDGIAIYNAIRDYRRAGGKINARVVGLAASMSTYIPLAAEAVAVEDNAIWMIHNPWSMAFGDQRDMRKEADILEGISNVLAAAYERQTGTPRPEIRQMMDEETWLFGEEIVEAGFADAIVPAGDGPETADEAVAIARLAVAGMATRMREKPEQQQQLDEVAALLDTTIPDSVVDGPRPAAKAEQSKEGVMDLKALKIEHSEVFAAAVQIGVDEERARVNTLRGYIEADPDNERVAAVVNEAIADGKTAADVWAKLQVAIRDGGKLDGENPPDVATESPGADEQQQFSALMAEVRGGKQ
jgi:ATP-dependent protease ClpP protease subunit